MKTTLSAIMILSICLACSISRAEENETLVAQTQPPTNAPLEKAEERSPESTVQTIAPEGPLSPDQIKQKKREAARHKRRVRSLNQAMQKEGTEYSQAKHERYKARVGGGTMLFIIGGVSAFVALGAAMKIGFERMTPLYSDDLDDDFYDDQKSEADIREEKELNRKSNIAKGFFFGGLATVAIGVPLFISGFRGKNRQSHLKQKDEILGTNPPTLKVSVLADPQNRSGGLALSASF